MNEQLKAEINNYFHVILRNRPSNFFFEELGPLALPDDARIKLQRLTEFCSVLHGFHTIADNFFLERLHRQFYEVMSFFLRYESLSSLQFSANREQFIDVLENLYRMAIPPLSSLFSEYLFAYKVHELTNKQGEMRSYFDTLTKLTNEKYAELEVLGKNTTETVKQSLEEAKATFSTLKENTQKLASDNSYVFAHKILGDRNEKLNSQANSWLIASFILGYLLVYIFVFAGFLAYNFPAKFSSNPYFWVSIKVGLVSIFSLAVNFSIRMYRSYLHMLTLNKHRSDLLHILPVLLEVGRTDSQKEHVLFRLIDAISIFTQTGLLKDEDVPVNMRHFYDSLTRKSE